jgi:hypothetical protein
MRKPSHVLNVESLRVIYFAHFQSVILYGLVFLGASHQFEKGILASKKDNKDYVRARA